MRISDWSSDVCSSDLYGELRTAFAKRLPLVGGKPMRGGITGAISMASGLGTRQRSNDRSNASQTIGRTRTRSIDADKQPSARQRADICAQADRSEEHTSELQSLMRISYAVF